MTHFLLDTDTASRLAGWDRATVNGMRRSGQTSISVSAVTKSEMLYGAHIRPDKPDLTAMTRAFLARVTVEPWDENVAEHHALIRAEARAKGRAAGIFDIMIAAHAHALGATLVTSDEAIGNLLIDGLAIVSWSGTP